MIKTDVHMHTNFSHDSDSTPEEMVQGAIAKGLTAITFTDHYDKDNYDWGPEDRFDENEYFPVMTKLRERYKDIINIRIGVEYGIQPYLMPFYKELSKRFEFDFIIGSVHSVERSDIAYGNIFKSRTDDEVYRLVLEETLEDVKLCKDEFDVLGHLDYFARYGKEKEACYTYKRYADLIDEILRVLIEKGRGLELNTAGLKYGLPFAHPHSDVLKRYRELGGEIITIGADGHKPEHIAYDFDKVKEILLNCGFKYYTDFEKRKPNFVEIT